MLFPDEPKRFLRVGLTGNIASGKTTVGRLFGALGGVIIDADRIVHDLQEPSSSVFRTIARTFGARVINPDGTLDRPALRKLILHNPTERDRLNAIVHPVVNQRRKELERRAALAGARVIIHDIPLLFEVLDPAEFDRIVLVDAPEEVRHRRLLTDRKMDPGEATQLLMTQSPSGPKRAKSDYIIDNVGNLEELVPKARQVWRALLAEAPPLT